MLKLIPASVYKDCTPGDFAHYFQDTFLLWDLTPNKRRIFNPQHVGEVITGEYLTIKKEWKPKTMKWDKWWESLSIIAPFPLLFNIASGCASWTPNISKHGNMSSGFKKSMPVITKFPVIRYYGKVDPNDITLQNIVFSAFGNIYRNPGYTYPSLREEPKLHKSATACKGDFIVDRLHETVLFKGTPVADYKEGKILIHKGLEFIRDAVIALGGASPEQVQVR